MRTVFAVIAAALALACGLAQAQAYRWVDKDGKRNGYWKGSGFADVKADDNKLNAADLLDAPPKPPRPAPIPPVPYGKSVTFPWKGTK